MSEPRVLISLRLEESLVQAIDADVGAEGTRSRSDVIRKAISAHLGTRPDVPGVRPVQVDFGSEMWHMFDLIHQRLGHHPEEVIKLAVDRWIESETERIQTLATSWEGLRRPGYDGQDDRPTA